MARRGFFAEMNYQTQQAEKRRRQQLAATYRAHAAAERQAEQSRKAAERARAAASRACAADQKAAEKEAARLRRCLNWCIHRSRCTRILPLPAA